jgi:lipid A disaccharide synthetase
MVWSENQITMQVLAYAEVVIFLGECGVFDEPTFLKDKVIYVGRFVRDFKYHIGDRERAPREMGIGNDVTVVSMLPGGRTEQRAPVFDRLVPAFHRLQSARKLLCWVAGDDFTALADQARGMPDVLVLKEHWPFEQLIVATDLVITKGNRVTIMEAERLGVPSISVSHGLNPVEDFIVPRIKSNLALRVKGINIEFLAKCLEDVLSPGKTEGETRSGGPGAGPVVDELLRAISKLGCYKAKPMKEIDISGDPLRTGVSPSTERTTSDGERN